MAKKIEMKTEKTFIDRLVFLRRCRHDIYIHEIYN